MIFAETERLILRRPVPEDLEPLLQGWGDPDNARYMDPKPDIRGFLVQLIADMQAKQPGETEVGGAWYQYIVQRRSDGAVVGDLGVGFDVPGERQVELGYRILRKHQRQGYAREAVTAMIDLLLERQGIHRFVAVTALPNRASVTLLRSLGFRQEGHFRQSFLCEGEWIDDLYFALLASEWPELRQLGR